MLYLDYFIIPLKRTKLVQRNEIVSSELNFVSIAISIKIARRKKIIILCNKFNKLINSKAKTIVLRGVLSFSLSLLCIFCIYSLFFYVMYFFFAANRYRDPTGKKFTINYLLRFIAYSLKRLSK